MMQQKTKTPSQSQTIQQKKTYPPHQKTQQKEKAQVNATKKKKQGHDEVKPRVRHEIQSNNPLKSKTA